MTDASGARCGLIDPAILGFLSINLLTRKIRNQDRVPGTDGIPALKNLRFSNVRVQHCPELVDATRIHPQKPLEGFALVPYQLR